MLTTHVLVVDDDVVLLEAFEKYLPRLTDNLIVHTCESSLKALRLVNQTDFDAIVVDIKMPELDGLELLRQIRKIRPVTPVLLITGYYGSYPEALEALRAGATDFIHKPMNGSTSSHLWKLRYRVTRPSRKKKCRECPWSYACRSWSSSYGTIVMREEIKISYRATPSTLP